MRTIKLTHDEIEFIKKALQNVSKRYLVTFWSSSRGVGFKIKIDAKSKEDAENKARDMNNSAYFTIDEIL